MSGSTSSTSEVLVSIYPFEGGQYYITGANAGLLQAQVTTSLHGSGSFSLTLAPGGPFGPNGSPAWVDLITPMSLVIIGIARGEYRETVMVGVVNTCQETETWATGKLVQRNIQVTGSDFGYFFTQASYYTLSFLAGAASGDGAGDLGFKNILSAAEFTGPPDIFGAAWFNNIMAGPASIMANLAFSYEGLFTVKFYELMAQFWEPYDANVNIPASDYFMISDGTWDQKFNTIFPFPYYEFFATTAPQGYYSGTIESSSANIPASFEATIHGFPVSVPQVVARVNPTPWSKPQSTSDGLTLPPLAMDSTRWNKLPLVVLSDGEGRGTDRSIGFSSQDVGNFFVINPTWLAASMGIDNGSNSPFIFTYAALADVASIHRYGYRPIISEVEWFSDPSGNNAKVNSEKGITADNFDLLISELSFRLSSWYEPAALMASASISMRLRPDIFIGSRFQFSPYKKFEEWQFYVEGVTHNFVFGNQSYTTLQLSRGLPVSVYADEALLLGIHTGNVQKYQGVYSMAKPVSLGPTLSPVNYQTAQTMLGAIASVFNTPQFSGG